MFGVAVDLAWSSTDPLGAVRSGDQGAEACRRYREWQSASVVAKRLPGATEAKRHVVASQLVTGNRRCDTSNRRPRRPLPPRRLTKATSIPSLDILSSVVVSFVRDRQ